MKAPTAIYVCNCYVNGIFQKEIRGTHGLIIHGIVLDGPRRNPPHSPKLAFQRIPCRLKIRGTIFEWLLFSCCKFCLDVDIICGIFCAYLRKLPFFGTVDKVQPEMFGCLQTANGDVLYVGASQNCVRLNKVAVNEDRERRANLMLELKLPCNTYLRSSE